eukprot:CAMPEP_0174320062 /NCGR_PEP_ID=MMETSP0810-20121108/9294_1 /TAXON_ID=73025 ORGANISM="Eutreptiella gymnastica-like, Strain CCMP1594" /NCGR_SAMPLE_ID=MMETSP0810 /ASSEMBLY_ACC=CAM_ASM_000659 /LENGTH=121 /DNA_ID=CAMNT_0015430839 /DNA_START=379 /DNA_END=742 /DNA_ORIENTATION=+
MELAPTDPCTGRSWLLLSSECAGGGLGGSVRGNKLPPVFVVSGLAMDRRRLAVQHRRLTANDGGFRRPDGCAADRACDAAADLCGGVSLWAALPCTARAVAQADRHPHPQLSAPLQSATAP